MTLPRPVVAGRTYFFTRVCTQHEFILRPDDRINQALAYCLVHTARETGIQVLSFLAMSNHVHGTVYDPLGVMPDFMQRFDSLAARMVNRVRRRSENVWAPGEASYIHCVEIDDVIDKTVYTLANPVRGELVEKASHWPGVTTLPWLDGRVVRVERPRFFANAARTKLPAIVSIRLAVPPTWSGSLERWAQTIRAGVETTEREAAAQRAVTGRRVVGRKAVLATSPTHRPQTPIPRRRCRPLIAAKSLPARLAALAALADFRAAYARAREKFVGGRRDVPFPPGTWFVVERWGANVAPS